MEPEIGGTGEPEKDKRTPSTSRILFRATLFLAPLQWVLCACAQTPQAPKDCGQIARKVLSDIRISYLAKEGELYIQSARRSFGESAEGCTSGLWYLAAARLLREPGQKGPLSGGGITLGDAKEALDKGLAADPSQTDLLTFVAYLSGLSPGSSPGLPANACERVAGAPAAIRAYVCGHAAMRRGEYASAEASFAAAEKEPPFPDVSLRRAEALLKLGRVQEAKMSAKRALERLHPGSPFALASGPTEAEIEALQKQARTLAGK